MNRGLVEKLNNALSAEGGRHSTTDPEPARGAFLAAMDNDLDTPAARQALVDLAETILDAASRDQQISEAQQALRELAGILGLRLDQRGLEERVIAGWQAHRARFTS